MATTQTTYAESQPIGQVGALANSEEWNGFTRTAGGNIPFGYPLVRSGERTVVSMASRVLVAAGAAGSPAPAGATITATPTTTKATKIGIYNLICISAGATGKWNVYAPNGKYVGQATTGTPATIDGLTFTITDSGTDPAVGEALTITVTGTGGGQFVGLAKRDLRVIHDTADRYEQYDNVSVIEWGVMFGTAGATVSAGEQVYWDESTGKYTNVSTNYEIPGAIFGSAAVDAGIVLIRLRKTTV